MVEAGEAIKVRTADIPSPWKDELDDSERMAALNFVEKMWPPRVLRASGKPMTKVYVTKLGVGTRVQTNVEFPYQKIELGVANIIPIVREEVPLEQWKDYQKNKTKAGRDILKAALDTAEKGLRSIDEIGEIVYRNYNADSFSEATQDAVNLLIDVLDYQLPDTKYRVDEWHVVRMPLKDAVHLAASRTGGDKAWVLSQQEGVLKRARENYQKMLVQQRTWGSLLATDWKPGKEAIPSEVREASRRFVEMKQFKSIPTAIAALATLKTVYDNPSGFR